MTEKIGKESELKNELQLLLEQGRAQDFVNTVRDRLEAANYENLGVTMDLVKKAISLTDALSAVTDFKIKRTDSHPDSESFLFRNKFIDPYELFLCHVQIYALTEHGFPINLNYAVSEQELSIIDDLVVDAYDAAKTSFSGLSKDISGDMFDRVLNCYRLGKVPESE